MGGNSVGVELLRLRTPLPMSGRHAMEPRRTVEPSRQGIGVARVSSMNRGTWVSWTSQAIPSPGPNLSPLLKAGCWPSSISLIPVAAARTRRFPSSSLRRMEAFSKGDSSIRIVTISWQSFSMPWDLTAASDALRMTPRAFIWSIRQALISRSLSCRSLFQPVSCMARLREGV